MFCNFAGLIFVAIEILSAVEVVSDTSPINYRSKPEQKLVCGWDEQIQWQRVQIYGEIKLHGLSTAVVLRAKVGQEFCPGGKLVFPLFVLSFDSGEQIFAFSQPSARGLGLIHVDPWACGAKTGNFCTRVWRPNIWVWFPIVYSYMLDQSCAFHKLPVQFSRVWGNVSPRERSQSALCFGLIVPVLCYTH